MKLLLLDLDGTIRETKSGEPFINDPYDQKPIEGSSAMCDRYSKDGWLIYGITNQKGVLAGFKTMNDMVIEQQETLKLFPCISVIFACPDEGESCYKIRREHSLEIKKERFPNEKNLNFRKPSTGMIRLIFDDCLFLFREKDEQEALFVGDRPEDQECAANANIPFIWAKDWLK